MGVLPIIEKETRENKSKHEKTGYAIANSGTLAENRTKHGKCAKRTADPTGDLRGDIAIRTNYSTQIAEFPNREDANRGTWRVPYRHKEGRDWMTHRRREIHRFLRGEGEPILPRDKREALNRHRQGSPRRGQKDDIIRIEQAKALAAKRRVRPIKLRKESTRRQKSDAPRREAQITGDHLIHDHTKQGGSQTAALPNPADHGEGL